jgi:diguanylate cyclase
LWRCGETQRQEGHGGTIRRQEFAVILPNTTLRAAVTVAEHSPGSDGQGIDRRSTDENLSPDDYIDRVATLRKSDTGQSLIERADTCLYAAKRHGATA